MSIAPEESPMPRHLLLATDLSARCDRALDRAAQLAREWYADLLAVNVLNPAASPDQALAWLGGASEEQLLQVARQQLAHDLATANVPVTLRLVRGTDATAAIRDTAASTRSDLVVTGVSCNETLGRFLLGSTVEQLANSLSQPLLVVRKRAHGPYQRIVVASDFSASSRQALLIAARFFPDRELVLYHATALAMSGLLNSAPPPGAGAGIADTECAAFLAATAFPEAVKIRPVVEYGAIESMLTRYVREHGVDLVVMGSGSRSGLMGLLLGSTAARLLDWLPCDVLLVHPPGAVP